MANTDDLLNQALAIRDAEQDGENTALRVGTLLISLVQSLQGMLPADEFEEAMEAMLPELSGLFAGISQGSVNRLQRGVIVLKSMGSTLDNVDGGNYSPTYEAGDLRFTGKAIQLIKADGVEDYTIPPTAFFVNAHTLKLYKWNGSEMVELGPDIDKPVVIDYLTAPLFSEMAIGSVYYLDTDHKLHIKTGSNAQVPFPIDPNCIYCDRSSSTTVIWNSTTSTWQQVGGGNVEVINSLGSTETRKPLSAKMGHDLLVLLQQIYNSLGNAAFWGAKPDIDWSSIGLLTHTISRTIAHGHSSSTLLQIADGSPLNETIIFDEGYVLDTLTVTMGGVDASRYISGNTISIPSVTGPVVIAATATSAKSITLNLTGCTSSNDAAGVSEGASYTTKIEGDGLNKVVGKNGFSVKMNGVALPIVLEDGYPRDAAPGDNNHIDIDSVPCVVYKSDLTSIENGTIVQIGKPYYEVRIPEVTGNITIAATAVDFIVAGPWYIGTSTPGSSETWCKNSEPIPIARVSPFDTIKWAHYGVLAGQTGNALANKAVCEFNSHYFHKTPKDSIWRYNQNENIITETGDRATQARLIFASFTYQYLSSCYVQGSGGNNTTAIFKPDDMLPANS